MYPFSCKDCKERKAGCHSTCETYKREAAEWREIRKKQIMESDVNAYTHNQIANNWHKRIKHKGARILHFK